MSTSEVVVKCKELRISFTKKQSELRPIFVNGNQLDVVRSAKLRGTQREYSSKPLKHRVVKLILVVKR